MAAKTVLAIFAQALIIQSLTSQCLATAIGTGLPYGLNPGLGLNSGLGLNPGLGLTPGLTGLGAFTPGCGAAATGGGFPVTSTSPIAPTGVSIVSENAIEGALTVGGNLPLLGSVAVDGAFPTAGGGAVSYGCGDGAAGIVNEGPISTGIVGPGLNGLRYGSGLGCGYY